MSDQTPRQAYQELRAWEKGEIKHDISRDFAIKNRKWLNNFGNDRYTYRAELYDISSIHWAQNEAKISHGYPYTAWLQMGLVYATGVYTARKQGLIKRNVFITRFWRFHYFDWIMFGRRSVIYAWAGGMVAGTVLFGNPQLALRRTVNRYHYMFSMEKIDTEGKWGLILPKLN